VSSVVPPNYIRKSVLLTCRKMVSICLGRGDVSWMMSSAWFTFGLWSMILIVLSLSLSPYCYFKKSYLVTFERPGKPINDTTVPNVKIWDALTGEVIHEKFYKSFAKSSWPYIRWSNDEKYCFVLSSAAAKEIQVYHQVQFQSCIQKIKGLTEDPIVSFSIAPSFELDKNAVVFHTFSPGTKGQPSKFAILRYPDRLGQSPIVVKSFFQAEEVTVKWNPKGDAALVLTQTSVDTTGDSYYGSTQLHLFLTDDAGGASNNSSIQVPLVKAGPVSSVEWCPDSTRKKAPTFLAISGKMPALAALYNGRTGEPIYVFGEQRE
jgi:translation initiation factor 2A